MMLDPDEVAAPRRRGAAPTPAAEPPAAPSPGQVATDALLARLRDGDDHAAAHRWLARIRGDRRPISVADLEAAIQAVAADEDVDVHAVRAGLDRVLAASGGVAAWETLLRQPRKMLGRALAAKDPPPPTAHDVRRQLQLSMIREDASHEPNHQQPASPAGTRQ